MVARGEGRVGADVLVGDADDDGVELGHLAGPVAIRAELPVQTFVSSPG